jgi:hypothetical protein
MTGLGWRKAGQKYQRRNQRIIFEIFPKHFRFMLIIYQNRITILLNRFLHNWSIKSTQMKLDYKGKSLIGYQIKNTRKAKLLLLKYFKELLHFNLFWEISFNF